MKTAYELRISDWSSDVCSSDLGELGISARVDQCSLGEHFEEQCVVLQIEAACRGEMDAQIGLDASTELPLIRLLDEELSSDVAMAREFAWQLGGDVEITRIARSEERRVGKEGGRT